MLRRTVIKGAALAALLSANTDPARNAARAAAGDASQSGMRRAVSERVAYPSYGFTAGSTRWMTTSRRHVAPNAASDLQLVFGNLAGGKLGDEMPGPNPIEITVQLEYPHGVIHNVLFRGQKTITIEGGSLITSDPLDLTLPDGAEFQVRTNVAATAPPYMWPLNGIVFAELDRKSVV